MSLVFILALITCSIAQFLGLIGEIIVVINLRKIEQKKLEQHTEINTILHDFSTTTNQVLLDLIHRVNKLEGSRNDGQHNQHSN